jgi:hypothetical protein
LAWRGEGSDGTTFLPGLTDPATLGPGAETGPGNGYDPGRSGHEGARSGSGRPLVGEWSAPGRTSHGGSFPQVTGPLGAVQPSDHPDTTTGPGGDPQVIPAPADQTVEGQAVEGQAVLFSDPADDALAEPVVGPVNGARRDRDVVLVDAMPVGGR